mmetsp:Transcript_29023/g.52868  ORF Transcript_29023/g.52868 Transcript_29023/m.52868 type:complete len:403 (-) Transcript_29023:38-1246(-)
MGGGAAFGRKSWERQFHLTNNVTDWSGNHYTEVFPVWTIAVTGNMKQLASATGDLKIHLWCLVTHQLLISLVGHADTIWRVSYSPDDTLLASSSADGTTRLWEVANGMPLFSLPRVHANWVWTLCWSPNSANLITGGSDTRLVVWRAQEIANAARRVNAMRANAQETEDPAWEKAARQEEGELADLARPLHAWQAHDKSIMECVVMPQDSHMILSCGAEGTLALWDTRSGDMEFRLCGHVGQCTTIDVNQHNDKMIATGGDDNTVRLWDLNDIPKGSSAAQKSKEKAGGYNLEHFTLKGHTAGIARVRFCGDGKLLASCSKDCEVRVFNPDFTNPTLNHKFTAHEAWVRDICWTADQAYLFSASTDGLIYAWEVPKKYRRNLEAELHKKKRGAKKSGGAIAN